MVLEVKLDMSEKTNIFSRVRVRWIPTYAIVSVDF
jgi:hypothetical protein